MGERNGKEWTRNGGEMDSAGAGAAGAGQELGLPRTRLGGSGLAHPPHGKPSIRLHAFFSIQGPNQVITCLQSLLNVLRVVLGLNLAAR